VASFLQVIGKIIGFPYQGSHTLYGNWQSDNAIDISVPYGTRVYAPVAGTLGNVGPFSSSDPHLAGSRINLAGVDKQGYYFAHLSKLATGIRQGATVKEGQLLGYTGRANGVDHLHFAVEKGSPTDYYSGKGAKAGDAAKETAAGTSATTAAGAGCGTVLVALGALWGAFGFAFGLTIERLT
jgi:murein DD-endopeptidase MepM/ murein hydrolase activator NlpD